MCPVPQFLDETRESHIHTIHNIFFFVPVCIVQQLQQQQEIEEKSPRTLLYL